MFLIDTTTNKVTGIISSLGSNPAGASITPEGSKVYVANFYSDNVSVIDTASNTMTATIPVGAAPNAFGIFIIRPIFAGTQHFSNCYGQSVAALARQYRGLNAAAAGLGYPGVRALQYAILMFCGG
jgi:YVTN family beta-propeller protein